MQKVLKSQPVKAVSMGARTPADPAQSGKTEGHTLEILHGNILYSESFDHLKSFEDSYLVIENGAVEGIWPVLPEKYRGFPVTDYGRGVIIPAFSDLHVHASQYIERGLGMDMLLADWLNQYTFPQEARFADMAYAAPVYDAFIDDMIRHGTFHACLFTTIHREAASYLIERMEEKGLYGCVGKVNMNTGAPDYLCETTEESLRETELFLDDYKNNKTAKPILTPRFAPTCSEDLMYGLGELARKYHVGVQTHLVESRWEAAEALRVFPGYSCDTEIYEKAGLMDHGPVIGAHFIFPSENDIAILKKHGGFAVHCPDATTNIIAGIMGTARLADGGVSLALGSDIGGGHDIGVYTQVARAVQLSKLKWFYEPDENRPITFANAFCLATRDGGSIFGKTGAFDPGYRFDALVIDGLEDEGFPLKPEQTAERFCYIGNDSHIRARYLGGRLI